MKKENKRLQSDFEDEKAKAGGRKENHKNLTR